MEGGSQNTSLTIEHLLLINIGKNKNRVKVQNTAVRRKVQNTTVNLKVQRGKKRDTFFEEIRLGQWKNARHARHYMLRRWKVRDWEQANWSRAAAQPKF